MNNNEKIYRQYIDILKEELIPAMGCTEPISIAYAASRTVEVLGKMPEKMVIEVSGNILKNVKSVVVPHTGGMRGIKAACVAGTVAGRDKYLKKKGTYGIAGHAETGMLLNLISGCDYDSEATKKEALEILSDINPEQIADMQKLLDAIPIEVKHADTAEIFDIHIHMFAGSDSAYVRIAGNHTNVVKVVRDELELYNVPLSCETSSETPDANKPASGNADAGMTDRSVLSIEKIVEFAEIVDPEDVSDILDRQVEYNVAIAREGLTKDYGGNIGKVLFKGHEGDINYRMRAWAAAASDARMNGCELPVIINSGSGNQGITASVPVAVYAEYYHLKHDELIRALCVSNLVTIHLKTGIGRLSAYCGAVSAGVGAAAGVAFLMGGRFEMIAHTVVNALAMDSGIICDGAKASCAAKIASAVDAGLLGLEMFRQGNQFFGGDGIVKKGVENTIANVGRLARDGMRGTDEEIIRIMLE